MDFKTHQVLPARNYSDIQIHYDSTKLQIVLDLYKVSFGNTWLKQDYPAYCLSCYRLGQYWKRSLALDQEPHCTFLWLVIKFLSGAVCPLSWNSWGDHNCIFKRTFLLSVFPCGNAVLNGSKNLFVSCNFLLLKLKLTIILICLLYYLNFAFLFPPFYETLF